MTSTVTTRSGAKVPVQRNLRRHDDHYVNAKGKRVCGSPRANRSGLCESSFLFANGRCGKHGGLTPNGIASPAFKTGKRSKYHVVLPERLRERYGEALADPELLTLRNEIAAIDARTVEVMATLDKDGCAVIWSQLQSALTEYRVSNAADRDRWLRILFDGIERGASDMAVWGQLGILIEQRRRLAETETKREKDLKLMVPLESVMALFGRFSLLVRETVMNAACLNDDDKRKVLAPIAEGMARMLGSGEPALV